MLTSKYSLRQERMIGVKIAKRNINNLRYADTTLMTQNEEELKSLLMRVKEEREKAGLKISIQKWRLWHPVTSLHGKQMGNNGNSGRLFLGSKITWDGDCSHKIKRCLLLGRKTMANLNSILKSRGITLLTKVHIVKAMVFLVVMHGCESWTIKRRLSTEELMLLNYGVREESWESLGLQGDLTSQS